MACLPFADEQRAGVDRDVSIGIDLLNPRDLAASNRQSQPATTIAIPVEREAGWQPAQRTPMATEPGAGEWGAVDVHRQRPMPLLLVIESPLSVTHAPQGQQIWAVLTQDARLPPLVETLDEGIAPRLARRQKHQVHTAQQVQPGEQREAERVAAAASRCHFVVDLRDARDPQPVPGGDEVDTECLGGLVPHLRDPDAAANDGHGVNRVKTRDPAATAEIPWSDQGGLLQIAGGRARGCG